MKWMPEGLVEFRIEFSPDGYVDRELGFNALGEVVHAKPAANYPKGRFGYFDSPPFDVDSVLDGEDAVEISRDEFERDWARFSVPFRCRAGAPQRQSPDPVGSPSCCRLRCQCRYTTLTE